MHNWPKPKNLKQLRGFWGLKGYYRRFVANYATIVAPLTELLKKDNFVWDDKANDAFELLKHTMTVTPILRLPDFTKQFIVETDASNIGVGGVLMQDKRTQLPSLAKSWGQR